jgi:hypothetical protein
MIIILLASDLEILAIYLGGYQWPPTYFNWLKTVCWQFTIFNSFLGTEHPGPF